jgi:hypothetical protein
MYSNKSWKHKYNYKGNATAKRNVTNGCLAKIPSPFGVMAITNNIFEASQYNFKPRWIVNTSTMTGLLQFTCQIANMATMRDLGVTSEARSLKAITCRIYSIITTEVLYGNVMVVHSGLS